MSACRRYALLAAGCAAFLAGPAFPQGRLAPVAPPETVVYAEIHGGALAEAWPDLALGRILAEPEVREFLEPVGSMLGMGLGMARMQLTAATGLDAAALDHLLRARWSVAWDGSLDPARPGVLVHLAVPEDPDVLLDVVEAVETEAVVQPGSTLEDREVAGVPVRRLVLDPDRPLEAWYLLDGAGLLAAFSEADLQDALVRRQSGAPGLNSHPEFSAAVERCWRTDSYAFVWIALEELLAKVGQATGAPAPGSFDDLAAQDYAFVAYGADPEPPALVDRFLGVPREESLLARALMEAGEGTRSQEILPAGTGFACALRLPGLDRMWNRLREALARRLGDRAGVALEPMQALEAACRERGVDLQRDLLARLGPEVAFAMDFGGAGLLPDVLLLFENRDPEAIVAALRRLAAGSDLEVREAGYRGHTLHWVELPEVPVGDLRWTPRPAWTVTRGWLVVAPWPQALRELLADLDEGRPRLPSRPDFARWDGPFREVHGAPAGWMYVDVKGATRFLLDNGAPLLQTLVPASSGSPVDVTRMPTTDVVSRHLFGLYLATARDGNRLYTEATSPTGCAGFLVGLTAGAVAVAFEVAQAGEPEPIVAPPKQEGGAVRF